MPSRLYDFACDRSARVVVCLLLWTGVAYSQVSAKKKQWRNA